MKQNNEYKKIYVQESDELLQQMNKNLLILEEKPKNTEALNEIFRAAHTLKSMSASMGYNSIADFSHKMEDLLDQLRAKKIQAEEAVVSLLFKSFDHLERMVILAQEDKSIDFDIQPIIAALDNLLIKSPRIKEDIIFEGIKLNVFEKKALARAKKDKNSCYHIRVILNKDCMLKSVRAFMVFRNLHAIGEVIKSFPDSQSLEEERFDQEFECIFISKKPAPAVKNKVLEILDIDKVVVKSLPVDPGWETEISENDMAEQQGTTYESFETGEQVRKIQSVRVDISRMDKLMNLIEELTITQLRLTTIGEKLTHTDLSNVIEDLKLLTDDLQIEIMQARLVPVNHIFERFPRLVRDLAKAQEKEIKFEITGGDIELDRTVLDEIGDPLIHLLKNAIDHGIEKLEERKNSGKPAAGKIKLSASREKGYVFISIEDDGRGIDVKKITEQAVKRGLTTPEEVTSMSNEQILLFTAHPGFSTKKEITAISGRGVGLDIVKQKTESLGGRISIQSELAKNAKITMRLPITTAVVQALLVRIDDCFNNQPGNLFAIPIINIRELIVVNNSDIKRLEHQETILYRDKVLPIVRFKKLFNLSANTSKKKETVNSIPVSTDQQIKIVVVEIGSEQIGVIVNALLSQQNIVIKPLTKELKGISGIAGVSILGDGTVALVLDVTTLAP